ncbi:MAG: hypothetical protein HQK97_05735, partial [Nitrospirae bacterium]|nr:hypothetical protein [Nitrospirota bacterium]
DSVSKDIAHSVSDNMHASNERLQAIEETLTEVKQKLGALNTEQIDAMAKSVEGGLASIAEEIKVSMGENNKADMDSLKTSFNDMAAKIERIDASVVNSLATILENTTKDVQSAAGEEIKTAISAEFRAIQQSLSAATTGQAEILRMMLEEQFRQAEAQVERAHSNKQEIEERLKRLGGFLADTAAK